MPDFTEDVTVSAGGDQLVLLGANTEDQDVVVGGRILVRDTAGVVVVGVSGGDPNFTTGSVFVRGGSFTVWDPDGTRRVSVHGGDETEGEDGGIVELLHPGDPPTKDGAPAPSAVKLSAVDRRLTIANASGEVIARLGGTSSGELRLFDSNGEARVVLGPSGNLVLGGPSADGDLRLIDTDGKERVVLGADEAAVKVRTANGAAVTVLGPNGNLVLGGGTDAAPGRDGDLLLDDEHGNRTVSLGAGEQALVITRPDGQKLVQLGKDGNLKLGGTDDADGDILLYPKDAFDGQDGDGWSIHLDGQKGDIILKNADCAEDFEVTGTAAPGSVLVIGDDGTLHPSAQPYDTRVAGVVSGAGGLRPGIVLGRDPHGRCRAPIALSGRVFCRVDATECPIGTGDLLTTSTTEGHAMHARERERAIGAILGKALAPLSDGRGLVPVLVGLQ